MIAPHEIFILLFVTLGPMKVLEPFAQRTHSLNDAETRRIAFWAFLVASLAIVLGGLLGRGLLERWHISVPAMTLAAGIVFFLVALRQLLEQYQPAHATTPEPLPTSPIAAACRIVFPTVLTPYGIAAVIALLANSNSTERTTTILTLTLIVMGLDLLAMLFARRILVGFTVVILLVLGSVLAVLQLALSIQIILTGLRSLSVVPG